MPILHRQDIHCHEPVHRESSIDREAIPTAQDPFERRPLVGRVAGTAHGLAYTAVRASYWATDLGTCGGWRCCVRGPERGWLRRSSNRLRRRGARRRHRLSGRRALRSRWPVRVFRSGETHRREHAHVEAERGLGRLDVARTRTANDNLSRLRIATGPVSNKAKVRVRHQPPELG